MPRRPRSLALLVVVFAWWVAACSGSASDPGGPPSFPDTSGAEFGFGQPNGDYGAYSFGLKLTTRAFPTCCCP